MKELKEDLKIKKWKSVYLFYGEEKFLVRHYENQIITGVCGSGDMREMNLDIFEGKGASLQSALDAAETLPFMGERRLIVFRDSHLFVTGRKEDSERLAVFMEDMPTYSVFLFVEEDVDKRSRLYKKTLESGRVVEFKTPGEKELVNWVTEIFKRSGKQISPATAALLLRMVGGHMDALYKEADKLIDYKGTQPTVTSADIEKICTKSLEARIFDLVDAVGHGKLRTALELYANLLIMKEQPIVVLSMLARQFRLILQCKALAAGNSSPSEIAAALGQRSFVVSACLRQGKNFTEDKLIKALEACLEADMNIKTGKMSDKLAVELLILEYSA